MKRIEKNNKLIAIVFDGSFEEGSKPQTTEDLALQVINLKHPKGKQLVPHTHEPKQRVTESLVECLIVTSGRVLATVYADKEPFEKVELKAGQALMIVDGGVGYEIVEDATMMEFKNGPFKEDKIVLS